MDIGVEFSHYKVIEHIGRGGMADVWSARDRRLNRTVAIKTIVRDLSAETEPITLFQREAQTIAALEHPHILPIYDFGEFEGQLYICMRYVTGGSLEDLLTAGALPPVETLRYARAIASALDHAHRGSVIHLDLKPSNILLDSNQSPYLADFGLATVLGPEGRAANPGYGTLLYMAPEQLTSDKIDHRADIYSFTILVYQMLVGELPFEATTSLALKQIQWQEDLPEPSKLGDDMAELLTPVLRRGTALNPDDRPPSLGVFVTDLERLLLPTRVAVVSEASFEDSDDGSLGLGLVTVNLADIKTMAGQEEMVRREAQDIYNKARRAWASGQGRFLLGVTHFMLMSDFYMRAEELKLELDDAGRQMLLRGALEYDHEVDHWWSQLTDDDRRWVALHAVRSQSAPARARALRRLETLPDSDPPRIPMLVAQALAQETDPAARRAAVNVLGTRAARRFGSGFYPRPATPGLTGRLLTVRTRQDLQLAGPPGWRDAVYSEDVDAVLAEVALDGGDPEGADLAARTIGRIRSRAALKPVAEAQRRGQKGALRALALIRDEAPSLSQEVSLSARLYAWLANTQRRLTDDPLHTVRRFVLAFLGALVAMGIQVYFTFRSEAIFNPERWSKTISVGLLFGVFIAALTLLAGEYPARLRGFWPWWARLLAGLGLGLAVGTAAWAAYTWLFLFDPLVTIDWRVMALGGAGLALGLTLRALFGLRGWAAVLGSAAVVYAPILLFHMYFWGELRLPFETNFILLYYDFYDQIFSLGLLVALLIALGMHAQALWGDLKALLGWARGRLQARP